MKNLTHRFTSSQSLWERFQALHFLLVQAGFASDKVLLHPDSVEALTLEMTPRPKRGEVFDPSPIKGAVTHAGPVDIVADPNGVIL